MKKYLFLRIDVEDMFFKYMTSLDKKKYYIFRPNSIFFKILFKLNLQNFMFGNWKYLVKKYDYIILGENYYSFKIAKYIKKRNINCKIIMFYMNTIDNNYKKTLNDKNIDEFWTFDKNDAKKYNLKYNTQFYSNEINFINSPIEYDILYLGRDKGRKKQLIELQNYFLSKKIKLYFKIITNEDQYIDYDEYLKIVSKTKCILDFNKIGQIGLSLRPMESIFFHKKLITNNLDIINYDFYNPNNIFIIGVDDLETIDTFLKTPYKQLDKKIIDKYDYKKWLERFEKNNEV